MAKQQKSKIHKTFHELKANDFATTNENIFTTAQLLSWRGLCRCSKYGGYTKKIKIND